MLLFCKIGKKRRKKKSLLQEGWTTHFLSQVRPLLAKCITCYIKSKKRLITVGTKPKLLIYGWCFLFLFRLDSGILGRSWWWSVVICGPRVYARENNGWIQKRYDSHTHMLINICQIQLRDSHILLLVVIYRVEL